MKKILPFLTLFVLILTLSACKGTKSDDVVVENFPTEIWEGETATLTGRYSGDDGRYFYEWESSDEDIATVTAKTDGVEVLYSEAELKAVKRGQTTITLKIYKDGKNSKPVYKEFELKVINETDLPDVENFSLGFSEITIKVGESFQLEPTVSPENAVFKENITYSSDDSNIVSIDFQGKVTGISSGSTVITMEYNNKTLSIDIDVLSVSDSIDVTIGGRKNPETINMTVGQRLYYSVSFDPADRDTKTFDFAAENNSVIYATNGYIDALIDGETYLTVYSKEYHSLKRDIKIIVTDPNKPEPIFPSDESSEASEE